MSFRDSCVTFLSQLCDTIEEAVRWNSESMSNTENAGVDAVDRVRGAVAGYEWECDPGRWLMYTLLLALPFSERVVRPDAVHPVWLCKPKSRVKGVQRERDLTLLEVVDVEP